MITILLEKIKALLLELKTNIQNLPSGSNYSTTEVEVGTWIDNKIVYELVIVLDSEITISTSNTIVGNKTGIDTLISGKFVSLRDDIWKDRACIFSYNKNNSNLAVRDIETQICKPGSFMIIRYTKTT